MSGIYLETGAPVYGSQKTSVSHEAQAPVLTDRSFRYSIAYNDLKSNTGEGFYTENFGT